jgi:hypothetical protein
LRDENNLKEEVVFVFLECKERKEEWVLKFLLFVMIVLELVVFKGE